MNRVTIGMLMLVAITAPYPGQGQPADVAPHRRAIGGPAAPVGQPRRREIKSESKGAMQVDDWFSLGPILRPPARPEGQPIGSEPTIDRSEEITVYGRRHTRDDEWRLDFAAKVPQYEASNSDAAQPLVAYPNYTSPDQQRMMSEKTDALGLCGALGGYVQCPNLPP